MKKLSKERKFWEEVVAKYPTVQEAKEALDCGERTIYNHLRDHRLKFKPIITDSLPEAKEVEIKHVPYPKLNMKPFKAPKARRDTEDMGLVIADPHFGKVTESYNLDIAGARLDYLLDSAMTIINLHRPIRKLWVFLTGDNVQGENVYQGSKVGDVECGAYEQIHSYAIPIFSKFLTTLSQGVTGVDVIGVNGNHGVYEKVAPTRTNWDGFFYSGLESAMVNQKSINIYPPKWFYQLVNIKGFRFFLIHGNQCPATQGIPLVGMRRKMQEWYAYVGGFNYAYAGHFHSEAKDQVNSLLLVIAGRWRKLAEHQSRRLSASGYTDTMGGHLTTSYTPTGSSSPSHLMNPRV